MVRCLWALLPAALLWGASFPLALAAAASVEGGAEGGVEVDPGRLVGGIYAANTGGAIVGALCSSMILIPWIGTGHSQSVLIALLAVSGLLMLVPLLRPFRLFNALAVGAAVVVAFLLAQSVSPVP